MSALPPITTRERLRSVSAMGHLLPHASQQNQPANSPSCHREVGRRPADCGVIASANRNAKWGFVLGTVRVLREVSLMRAIGFAVAVLILSAHAAFATPMLPSDIQAIFFDSQPFTASTQSGTKFKMNFMPDGTMTREPRGTAGGKSSGTWKLDASGFCTTWKQREVNCYAVAPSGKNKWSVQSGSITIATWVK
jgi:hypothetical protein